ncbi:MBL fold metallo-hydrolase [Pseudonocardia eucalypti]|uniref:MBL fold metallo-hydrolase n=1 Tax=Pseudonocardia eucalypti TaxID=648755 RepID=A0ABP9QE56_9PSEU|nr:glyoxylase-like metal-dependent hydrolase (beta-lactamase superfamily II) [Pseudonocardia eucalypti]
MRLEPDDPDGDWTTPGAWEVSPGLFRIPLPLPSDGLKAVNVYAMRDGDGLVMIDSGWAIEEARVVLDKALAAIGNHLGEVHRFLITHVHRDHYTLAVRLRREFGNHISLGIRERESLRLTADPKRPPWASMLVQVRRGGAGRLAEMLAAAPVDSDDTHRAQDWAEPDKWLAPPTDVELRDRTLHAIPTPGHTQGHVVFVDEQRDTLFAGDHVLPHITPSIGFEAKLTHSPLGDYLDSLRLVRGLPDRRYLPAHGPVAPSVHNRVDELLAHHAERLDTMAATVAAGAATAYEVAKSLTWTRRGRQLEELELPHQCMAVAETSAHLDLLAEQGRLHRTDPDGISRYTA